jgi:3-keto-disaccharide hydrolase
MSFSMRTSALSLAFVLASFPSAQAGPSDPVSSSDWRPLFDGHSLNGWEHVGPGEFVVEDGVLRTQGGMGLLWYSRETFGDCIIRVVYKTGTPRSNSGIYIRIADKPKEPWFAVHHGFEVQIMDTARGGHGTGSIYTFANAKAQPAKSGEWNTLEITLKGKRIQTTINGVAVAEFDSSGLEPQKTEKVGEGDPARGPRPESGYIGLQNHDKNSVVFFKEVSVRPLTSKSR